MSKLFKTNRKSDKPPIPSSALTPKALNLLIPFYEKRQELNSYINNNHSSQDFIDAISSNSFQDEVATPIQRLAGIVGVSYAVVNQVDNSIWFLRNPSLSEREKRVPFFHVKANGYFGNEEDIKAWENAQLIDLIFESENDSLSLKYNKIYKAPYFLQNIPPHQSKFSFPLLPFEKKLRDDRKINYLFCYTGEVLFHVYAWRWLIKYAQYAGFDASVNLQRATIKNKRPSTADIWDLSAWKHFVDIPEKKWLRFVHKLSKAETLIEQRKVAVQRWKEVAREIDGIPQENELDFVTSQWEYLGLTETSPIYKNARLALQRYARHILKNINPTDREGLDDLFTSAKTLASFRDTSLGKEIEEINNSVDAIIQESNYEKKEKKLDRLFKYGEKKESLLHFIYRKIIFEALITKNFKSRDQITVKDLFRAINIKARFPLFATFFQTALSPKKIPVEHYYFPIGKSFHYSYKLDLPQLEDQEEPKENSNVLVALVSLKPIWAINDHEKYYMTEDGEFFTDLPNSQISKESFTRLDIVQDYLKSLAPPLLDFAFYGGVIENRIHAKAKQDTFFFQAHEIRRIIECIQEDTPGFILDEVRLYFNVIYGSREFIIRSFYDGAINLPKEYRIGSNYKELVDNAAVIASKIQVLVDLLRESKLKSCTPEVFEKRVQKKMDEIQNKINPKVPFSAALKNLHNDEKAIAFHFLSAVICALRNTLKHKEESSPIRINLSPDKRRLEIINLQKSFSPLAVNVDKESPFVRLHPGSTENSLRYYISVYSEEEIEMKRIGKTKEFRSSLPIPT